MKRFIPMLGCAVVAIVAAIASVALILYEMFHGKNSQPPSTEEILSSIAEMSEVVSRQNASTMTAVTTEPYDPFAMDDSISADTPLADWKSGYDAGYQKGVEDGMAAGKSDMHAESEETYKEVKISGDFTATVRRIMPDYFIDTETNRCAVVTLFQDAPFCLLLEPEQCEQITEDTTYTFVLAETDVLPVDTNYLWADGWLSSDYLRTHTVSIAEIRLPEEGEGGMESSRLCWEEA